METKPLLPLTRGGGGGGHKRQRSRDDQDLLLLSQQQLPSLTSSSSGAFLGEPKASLKKDNNDVDDDNDLNDDNDAMDPREQQFQSLANHQFRQRQQQHPLARFSKQPQQSQSSILDYLSKSPILKRYYQNQQQKLSKRGATTSSWHRHHRSHQGGQHVLLLREDHVSLDRLNPHPHSQARQSSVAVAVINLVATVCGGGVLSLPLAFAKAGLIPTCLLMVYGCVVTDFSLVCLVDGARKTGARNYGDLCAAAFGSVTQILNSAVLGTMLCGTLIAYQVLVKDIWTPVVFFLLHEMGNVWTTNGGSGGGGGGDYESGSGTGTMGMTTVSGAWVEMVDDDTINATTAIAVNNDDDDDDAAIQSSNATNSATPEEANMLLACILLAALPLMLKKDLHALRHTCYVGFSSCVLLMLAVIFRASQKIVQWNGHGSHALDNNVARPQIKWFSDDPTDILFAFPIVILCYFCSYNVLAVHSQLVHPSRQRIRWVLQISMWTCFVLFVGVGMFGYLYTADLGPNMTPDNILLAFDFDDTAILAGRIGFCFTLLFGLPLVLLPCREALMGLPGQFQAWQKDRELIAQYQKLNQAYEQQHPTTTTTTTTQTTITSQSNEDQSLSSCAESTKSMAGADESIDETRQKTSPHLVVNGVDFDGNAPMLITTDPERRHGTSIVYGSINVLGSTAASATPTTPTPATTTTEKKPTSPLSSVSRPATAANDTISGSTPMSSDFPLDKEEKGISPATTVPSSVEATPKVLPGLPTLSKKKRALPMNNNSRNFIEWWENSVLAHVMVTVSILCCTYLVAVSVPGVAVVWSIVGSSLAVWIAFVVPTACFLKIRQHKGLTMQALYAWLLLFASCVAMVVCTRQAILNAAHPL